MSSVDGSYRYFFGSSVNEHSPLCLSRWSLIDQEWMLTADPGVQRVAYRASNAALNRSVPATVEVRSQVHSVTALTALQWRRRTGTAFRRLRAHRLDLAIRHTAVLV